MHRCVSVFPFIFVNYINIHVSICDVSRARMLMQLVRGSIAGLYDPVRKYSVLFIALTILYLFIYLIAVSQDSSKDRDTINCFYVIIVIVCLSSSLAAAVAAAFTIYSSYL